MSAVMQSQTRPKTDLVTTAELAEIMHCSRITAWRIARANHPGFSIKFGGRYQVPMENVERVLAGETPEQIAATAPVYHRHPATHKLVRA